MLKEGMQKSEIERELTGKGDYVKIDLLSRYVQKDLATDVKKYCLTKLAEIYAQRGMYSDAGKMYENLASISLTTSDKNAALMKVVEMFIRSGDFRRADDAMKRAMAEVSIPQRNQIYSGTLEFYKRLAAEYERTNRRSNAVKLYEKIVTMPMSETERKQIKEKLVEIYGKIGKMREHFTMKRSLESKDPIRPAQIRRDEKFEDNLGLDFI